MFPFIVAIAVIMGLALCLCCGKRQGESPQRQSHTSNESKYTQHTQDVRVQDEAKLREDHLDLHGYHLLEAKNVLRKFLRERENNYYDNGCKGKDKFAHVITGQGLHSPDGVGKIKEMVQDFLNQEGKWYTWTNPGMVKIDLN